MRQQKKRAPAGRHRGQAGEAKAALECANSYIVRHYAFGCLGQKPERLVGENECWLVPVLLTSPGLGAVGQVGTVAVDAATRRVVAATARREVDRAIRHLKESKRDELEAAFHRARTV
jgi:hypothetical protein